MFDVRHETSDTILLISKFPFIQKQCPICDGLNMGQNILSDHKCDST